MIFIYSFRLIFLESLAAKLTAMQDENFNAVTIESENLSVSTERWYQDEESNQKQQATLSQQDNTTENLTQLLDDNSFDYGLDGLGFELKAESTDDFFKELQAQIEPFLIDWTIIKTVYGNMLHHLRVKAT